jgi:hypothetical protein
MDVTSKMALAIYQRALECREYYEKATAQERG